MKFERGNVVKKINIIDINFNQSYFVSNDGELRYNPNIQKVELLYEVYGLINTKKSFLWGSNIQYDEVYFRKYKIEKLKAKLHKQSCTEQSCTEQSCNTITTF